jgi:hypothetical protein
MKSWLIIDKKCQKLSTPIFYIVYMVCIYDHVAKRVSKHVDHVGYKENEVNLT